MVVFEKEAYWAGMDLVGQNVELWVTLKGLEVRKEGVTHDIVTDYWDRLSRKV